MRTTLRTVLAVLLALTMSLFFVVACGDDDDSAEESVESTPTEATEEVDDESTTTTEESTTTTAEIVEGAELTITTLEGVGEGYGEGTFTATGEAADQGMVCAAGDAAFVSMTDGSGNPPPWNPPPVDLLVDWEFTCDDGSGTFMMRIAQPAYVEEDFEMAQTGAVMGEGDETWEIISGTDAYTSLTGEGTRNWYQVEIDTSVETTNIGTVAE